MFQKNFSELAVHLVGLEDGDPTKQQATAVRPGEQLRLARVGGLCW